MTAAEFARWYWLTSELQELARRMRISASGSKEALAARIAEALVGDDAGTHHERRPAPRRAAAQQLGGELSEATVIPAGQRCSQHLRRWFTEQLGPGFRFDGPMREFFAETPGTQTLGDALAHWHRTRDAVRDIDPQFEYNRFTRAHRAAHPDADRATLLAAWTTYRNTPLDERGRS